jgi:hypothetical protein
MRLLEPYSFSVRRVMLAASALAIVLAVSTPAFADDAFNLETTNWMSFDRYKDKPSTWIAPDDRQAAVLRNVVMPAPTLPPLRPVVAPLMPGVVNSPGLVVDTTEDDSQQEAPALANFDTSPDLQMRSKNWQDAADAARIAEDKKKRLAAGEDDEHPPLDVRLSYLPHSEAPPDKVIAKVVPKPVAKKVDVAEQAKPATSTTSAAAKPAAPAAPVATAAAAPAQAADPQACAAIDAYKKRQLAAIESDRQTLAALQGAIASLGLKKQLGFMVSEGGLTVNTGNPNIDLPQTPVPPPQVH